jgi:hypothetical protein
MNEETEFRLFFITIDTRQLQDRNKITTRKI